uniref:NADH dehydrogenase [ubiquinone] 1 alpha subcomplex subunit 6 n=1 Tax=Octopus bimaculoides TaxID=37653 RepID=A0A0L8HH27_OCTBM
MAASRASVQGMKLVKPILSVDSTEARRRVLNLYKAWYRHLPYLGSNGVGGDHGSLETETSYYEIFQGF